MNMNKLFLSLVLLIAAHTAKAQTPEEITDTFFKIYQKNKPVEAIDELYAHNPWMARNADEIEKLKTQFRDLKKLVGEYNGHELLYNKNIKNCFVLTTYLVKFDRQPVRFNFEFYKPKDKWILYSFSYDDSFDDDLENALKQEILELTK